MTKHVGFMGLGIMGQAMVANLLKKGFPVTVHNRSAQRCQPLAALGAAVANSPQELAQACDVAVVMVTGPEALENLLFGPRGAAQGLAGKVLVNMSSVAPAYTRDLDARLQTMGITLVDAPVSGSKKPAEDATLMVLAGGPRDVVDGLADVFLAMARKVVYCGAAGQGSMMKMMNNLLLGVQLEAFAEALRFGEKGGLDMDAMLDVVLDGPLAAPLFKLKAPMVRERDYPANFPLKHMTKDLKFVLDTAYDLGALTPAASAVLGVFIAGCARGLGEEDVMAVDRALYEMLGD